MIFRISVKKILSAGVCGVILLIPLSFTHPFGNPRQINASSGQLLAGARIPEPLRELVERKCGNCHSEQVEWPFYSRIAPVSWLLEHDVSEARAHLNLSRWDTYSNQDKLNLLTRLAAKARSGEMPPARYTAIHSGSKLLSKEQDSLYEWAKAERRRLRTAGQQTPPEVPVTGERKADSSAGMAGAAAPEKSDPPIHNLLPPKNGLDNGVHFSGDSRACGNFSILDGPQRYTFTAQRDIPRRRLRYLRKPEDTRGEKHSDPQWTRRECRSAEAERSGVPRQARHPSGDEFVLGRLHSRDQEEVYGERAGARACGRIRDFIRHGSFS